MEFPSLAAAKQIAIDIETCDPGLKELGPGTHRGSYIAGLAIGTNDGYREYFPMRHEGGGNLDPVQVLAWAKDELCRPNQPKVGAHLIYDLEFLYNEGVPVAGPFYDIQYAEALLDEHRFSYEFDEIAFTRLGERKTDEYLDKLLAARFGGKANHKAQAANIWRASGNEVAAYAKGDVDLPLRILAVQTPLLQAQQLSDLFNLECNLIPILLLMRQQGVRVNVEKAEALKLKLELLLKKEEKLLLKLCGKEINYHAAESIAPVFDTLGVLYPATPKTKKPSFDTDWLLTQQHPIAHCIYKCRQYSKYLTTFIQGYILDKHINGRVYGQFHPLRGNGRGTISGRFSSSNPNLENLPARDEEWGPEIRSLFIPEEGEEWIKDDYSQIEYRFICHYGRGPSAEAARSAYRTNPDTDFHQWVSGIAGIERKPAKTLNFGKSYGMGVKSTIQGLATLGIDEATARAFIKKYDTQMPFVKELLQYCSKVGQQRGYVKTILGRRARFIFWEPLSWSLKNKPLPFHMAQQEWGNNIQRAMTFTALNRICQGGAADVFKTALVQIHQAGIMDVLKAPRNLDRKS